MIFTDKRYILLKALKESNSWLSGTELSKSIGITRAGISKHVQALRKMGYEIETQTNKGIRYIASPNKVLPDEIRPLIEENSIVGSKFFFADEIDSTNKKASALAEDGTPDGTVVLAEKQTAGKGRLGRKWESPENTGIYCSVVLRPQLALPETALITFIVAIAISEAIRECCPTLQTQIKWPNDILVNDKKIVGVLTEASAEMQHVNHVIVGFGINVNTYAEHLPPRFIFPASSLAVESKHDVDRVTLAALCLKQLDFWYNCLNNGGADKIVERWKKLSTMIGRAVVVEQINSKIEGTIEGVSKDGALLVKDKNKTHVMYSGDVKYAGVASR
ncbi:MAG: biotin--[acetyl-CoA-carboxylase] ligase [Kiritimatiellae bacterium]|jgi:BirA family biotin operon repressor/biotin-[acetyl-CoA-carboxylase] ligase|nr:biotin--[acetyl-CoA-carboxylase] ligase [Kiritimatiellia bacterium]